MRKLESALTYSQWEKLEQLLFDGAGEALTSIRDWARGTHAPPVGAVVMTVLRVLSSVPAGTTFDAGIGPGSLNMLVALVGRPGAGKDKLAGSIADGLMVSRGALPIRPQEHALGSGEGVATVCRPVPGENPVEPPTPADPVIFAESEAGRMEALMKREGATLRPTIMSMYSGNQLGSTNKAETVYVPRNSYTAGLWVGVQPDKAGALLGGPDDGLAHRFVWTELVDPTRGHENYPRDIIAPVSLPSDLKDNGVTFHESIVEETRQASTENLLYGPKHNHQGHRHQTRLKVAAGLALVRSSSVVSLDDWERAGVLMDYSDRVRGWCIKHLEAEEVRREVKREHQRDAAEDIRREENVKKSRELILSAVRDEPGAKRSELYRKARRYRDEFNDVFAELVNERVVIVKTTDGVDELWQGPNFPEGLKSVA